MSIDRSNTLDDTNPGPAWRDGNRRGKGWVQAVLGLAASVVIVVGVLVLGRTILGTVETPVAPVNRLAAETPTHAATRDLTSVLLAALPPAAQAQNTPAPTPVVGPDEQLVELTPQAGFVGWVRSNDSRSNHFGDSYVYTGLSQGEIFHGAMQFDLTAIARGAPISYAALVLTGLDDGRLNRSSDASWQVRWLDPSISENWGRVSFQEIHNAPVLQTILPAVGQADLAPAGANVFPFSQQQLAALQQALVDEQARLVFRLDGPEAGAENLFAWDSGYGSQTAGNRPQLLIVVGPTPATPPAAPTRDLIVVTSTPTPQNVLTAAVIMMTATAAAAEQGTATPTPLNMVTATPVPENQATAVAQGGLWVVTATPTPANQATQRAEAAFATAQAMTTGTWTPTPTYFITATPTATFVIITNTPTPNSVSALLAWAVAEATRVSRDGPPTPIPQGFITATPRFIVATSTPTPENAVTAQAIRVLATVVALTTGTYTPMPAVITPTPTATATPQPLIATLAPTLTPTAVPGVVPESLRGKIVFRSDRLGSDSLFVLDPSCLSRAGGCTDADVSLLTEAYPYVLARQSEGLSPDGFRSAVVQFENVPDLQGRIEQVPRVFVQDSRYGTTQRLSSFDGAAYDPVWSPADDRVALVSTEPGNDEIFVINADGSGLRRLTTNNWEWDKHPTWSPDGQFILFYSNRDSGRRQLWVMKPDGSEQRNVSNNVYNDWDPIWIK
jgi:hypothetical protein